MANHSAPPSWEGASFKSAPHGAAPAAAAAAAAPAGGPGGAQRTAPPPGPQGVARELESLARGTQRGPTRGRFATWAEAVHSGGGAAGTLPRAPPRFAGGPASVHLPAPYASPPFLPITGQLSGTPASDLPTIVVWGVIRPDHAFASQADMADQAELLRQRILQGFSFTQEDLPSQAVKILVGKKDRHLTATGRVVLAPANTTVAAAILRAQLGPDGGPCIPTYDSRFRCAAAPTRSDDLDDDLAQEYEIYVHSPSLEMADAPVQRLTDLLLPLWEQLSSSEAHDPDRMSTEETLSERMEAVAVTAGAIKLPPTEALWLLEWTAAHPTLQPGCLRLRLASLQQKGAILEYFVEQGRGLELPPQEGPAPHVLRFYEDPPWEAADMGKGHPEEPFYLKMGLVLRLRNLGEFQGKALPPWEEVVRAIEAKVHKLLQERAPGEESPTLQR